MSGLTATLQAGTFANGNGSLTYTISGTPLTSGVASFAINIGGKTCTINRSVLLPVGLLGKLECSTVANSGILTAIKSASGVTSIISYSGGNGGTHNGQIVNSTGVTGLIATLQAGTFSNGTGSLTYVITGTPAAIGSASFALNIGGKTCVLTRMVEIASYGSNITDIEGNTYKTVNIGTQQWMGENLKTSKYSDGTSIPNITDNSQWGNNKTGAWANYNNDLVNTNKYGKLYNWYAVSKTTNGNKNICPIGWHVPTDLEWTVLTDYLGGANVAGGKMKEVGTTDWSSPNTDATNESLFTGRPSGYRYFNGNFSSIGNLAYWWSSVEASVDGAWARYLYFGNGNVVRSNFSKINGYPIRCLKD